MSAPVPPPAPASGPAVLPSAGFVHLRAAGVSLLLDARGEGLPVALHWGPDLGADVDAEAVARALAPALARSALDVAVPTSLLPERSVGYRGRPGLSGSRAGGRAFSPSFRLSSVRPDGESGVVVEAADSHAGLTVEVALVLEPGGLLRVRPSVRNDGGTDYTVEELGCVLPVPERAGELLDLTGRWLRERHPQRHPFVLGAYVREGRHGRTGHDATLLLAAGTPGFANRSGEVWAVHLGWSGDSRLWAERGPALAPVLGAAELLAPGEVVLAPGERYEAPESFAAYSPRGLDGVSDAFHAFLRSRPSHPRTPRPVVLNTWEAVYFDHDLARLQRLADTAAALGVERFVLDDGWFLGRRDDTRGLGDWVVDPDVWPDGLAPLVDHVTGLGMQFGLWVEPEMVNLDSDLARAHPDWVLGVPGRTPPPWRDQQVLDLTNPDAYAHVLGQLDTLLSACAISYLKWDHNRDLVDAADADGRPAVHRQTLAAYRLLDALRERHPGLEIESCSSGGARVDLGVLARTDRVWASDTNDPLERQTLQRWTELLLPPELVGAHVGPPQAHTTSRVTSLAFRVATALFGSFGFEWDVEQTGPEERALLAEAVQAWVRLRPLLHGGTLVHGDLPEPSALLTGVVAQDGGAALFSYAQLTTSALEVPAAVQLPGLDPTARYRVRPLTLGGASTGVAAQVPLWWQDGEIALTGAALATTGLRLPVVDPAQALLLELVRQDPVR
jgi:alpha-galactosidase